MTISVDDLVRKEIVCCVSGLVSDLLTLTADISRDVAQSISFSYDELLDLQCRPDYEEAGREHIKGMDRDELLEALEAADVEDARDAHQRAEVASHHAIENNLPIEDWHAWWENFMGVSDETLRDLLIAAIDPQADGWQDFTNEHDLEPDDIEVYEHYIVSNWLYRRLEAHGEVVGEIGNLSIWGRCTTGQMISMDHVIQQIHAELVAA